MAGAPDGCGFGETLLLDELRVVLGEQQVTRQFWPERLELMTEFPMTPSGKVQKFGLRDMLVGVHSSERHVAL